MDLDAIFDEAHGNNAAASPSTTPVGVTDLGTIGLAPDSGSSMDLDSIFDAAHSQTDSTSTPGFLESVWQGIKDTPSGLVHAIGSIPSGVSNITNTILHPIDSLKSGTTEKTARGVGGIASGIAGAGAGSILGPIGTIAGGAAGLLGFDLLNQLTGSDAPTTPQEDVAKLGYNIGQGAGGMAIAKGVSGAAKGVGSVVGKLPASLDESAAISRERALGVQYGDKTKGLGRAPVYLSETGEVVPWDELSDAATVEAPIQQQISKLKDQGFFDNAPDAPDALKLYLERQKADTGAGIQSLIKQADEARPNAEIVPDFASTKDYLNGLTKSDRTKLIKEAVKIVDDYRAEPGTGLAKLVNFKEKIGAKTNFDQTVPRDVQKLYRRMYYDLRTAGENAFDQAVPEKAGAFAESNQTFGALANLGKTLNKRLAKKSPTLWGYLQGGSKPAVALGSVGSALFGAPGLGLSGAGILGKTALNVLEARNPVTAARTYDSLSRLASSGQKVAGNIANGATALTDPPLLGALQGAMSDRGDDTASQTPPKSLQLEDPRTVDRKSLPYSGKPKLLPDPNQGKTGGLLRPVDKKDVPETGNDVVSAMFNRAFDNLKGETMDTKAPKKTNIALVEKEIDQDPYLSALYEAESNRNPSAKNPKSSATGGFQFVKATAKGIGLLNPLDLEESLVAVRKLTAQNAKQVGTDPATLYAAHYLGAPVAKKWLNGDPLNKTEAAQVKELETSALPRFMRIYKKVLQRKTGQVEA